LKAEGFTVGLIGRQETSFDLPSADVRSWEYDDASANIELLQNCKLYLGTDTGTSHLAAFCSTPMIVFRDPGPWPLVDRMAQTTKSFFKFLPEAWDSPPQVIEAALSYLNACPGDQVSP
jgi:hypothetical protein